MPAFFMSKRLWGRKHSGLFSASAMVVDLYPFWPATPKRAFSSISPDFHCLKTCFRGRISATPSAFLVFVFLSRLLLGDCGGVPPGAAERRRLGVIGAARLVLL
ncbi:MAG TPA: hypothetical protein VGG19_13405 [Tepidisphaeraceae bacterium]|jgi:hypothetical protein